ERSTQIGHDHPVGEVRLVGDERISRIEDAVAVVDGDGAAIPVRSGLGEDLDAAESEAVVLGGEGVLVDADLADRLLGRKLAAAEAVDIDLPAIGSGARSGERLQ